MGEPPAASKERELIFEFDVFDDGPIGTGENTNAESVSSILPSISSMPTTSSSTSSTSTEIPPHLNTVSDAPSISLAPSELQSAESSLLPSTVSDFPSFVPSQAPTSIGPFGTIEYVGNEGTFYSPYPLGICKGDCDTDEDVSQPINWLY